MPRIDSSDIARVLNLLTADRTQDVRSRRTQQTRGHAVAGGPAAKRDIEVLRSRLRVRLTRLKRESVDFDLLASEVTVREILAWEFGDTVLNHPEFGRVVSEVTVAMVPAESLGRKLSALIAELSAAE